MNAVAMIEYRDRDDKPATRWRRIGAAFENQDGSITVQLDAIPLQWLSVGEGRLQIRADDDDRGRSSGGDRNRNDDRRGGGGYDRR